ncbi:MAG: arsenite methyltransferase [Bacteroidia bacterium]|nr:arsenite methyltransferase [Bacteroidia bacterium]
MKSDQELKAIVRKKYAAIASQKVDVNKASCCGAGDISNEVYNIMTDDYSPVEGYQESADLGLGCGLPTEFAHIVPGDVVLDLGSGAGNDCFVARHETGQAGKVIGVDFTPEMVVKARTNAETLGFHNVEFRQGDIEDMPVNDNTIDVVVSNCVLNLLPNKNKIFSEICRVLRETGHFSISDIVLKGDLPKALKEDAEMYAGCVAGAIQKDEYLSLINKAGFHNITIQKEKPIHIPADILSSYMSAEEIKKFNTGGNGIYSITVFASKSDKKRTFKKIDQLIQQPDCEPGGGCC